jgi:GNAT superfamily N-acetyltransferase
MSEGAKMQVVRHEDPETFRNAVESYLLADEPRHNLIFGLLQTLIEQPAVYPDFRLWQVEAQGETMGAALVTLPHKLVLAAPARDEALVLLAQALAADPLPSPLSGVVGGLPEADTFATIYCESTGGRTTERMQQGIYALEEVTDVPIPPGHPRRAQGGDLELLLAWTRAFAEEADPGSHWDEEEARRRLAHRLEAGSPSGYWIWEDGEPVSLTGYVAPTRTGIRIGPVYTPPGLRQRGYATALVARVSREMLARGRRFCFLYTDMDNPTSNAIYQRIGYRLVCRSAMIAFEGP